MWCVWFRGKRKYIKVGMFVDIAIIFVHGRDMLSHVIHGHHRHCLRGIVQGRCWILRCLRIPPSHGRMIVIGIIVVVTVTEEGDAARHCRRDDEEGC